MSAPHSSINLLNIFTFGYSSFVTSNTLLGEFVNTFIGRSSPSFDHIKNTTFIRFEASNFTSNVSTQFCTLSDCMTT